MLDVFAAAGGLPKATRSPMKSTLLFSLQKILDIGEAWLCSGFVHHRQPIQFMLKRSSRLVSAFINQRI